MTIFLYILKVDGGFAPNPFHGYCTLACCKPKIRAVAREHDWVLGITPRHLGNALAYAMEVAEVLTFEEYFADARFRAKKPVRGPGVRQLRRCGDNCYRPLPGGGFAQLPSAHYDHVLKREDAKQKQTDLGGKYVLVSKRFAYFGAAPRKLPVFISDVMPARFSRRVEQDHAAHGPLLRYLRRLPMGIHSAPRHWRPGEPWGKSPRCA